MIRYECPTQGCGKLLLKAGGVITVRVETRCRGCGKSVEPRPASGGVVIRAYRCSRCSREQTCVDPVDDRVVCIPCGTPTLVIVGETRPESPARAEPANVWTSR